MLHILGTTGITLGLGNLKVQKLIHFKINPFIFALSPSKIIRSWVVFKKRGFFIHFFFNLAFFYASKYGEVIIWSLVDKNSDLSKPGMEPTRSNHLRCQNVNGLILKWIYFNTIYSPLAPLARLEAYPTVEGHLNPEFFNPQLQPQTFQPWIFQPQTFQPQTLLPHEQKEPLVE